MAHKMNSILDINTAKTPHGLTSHIEQGPHLNFKGENRGGIHVYWNAVSPGITIHLGPIKLLSNSEQNAEIEIEGTFTEIQNAWNEYKATHLEDKSSELGELATFLVERVAFGGIWFMTETSAGGQFVGGKVEDPFHSIWGNLLYIEVENHKEAFRELLRMMEEGTIH